MRRNLVPTASLLVGLMLPALADAAIVYRFEQTAFINRIETVIFDATYTRDDLLTSDLDVSLTNPAVSVMKNLALFDVIELNFGESASVCSLYNALPDCTIVTLRATDFFTESNAFGSGLLTVLQPDGVTVTSAGGTMTVTITEVPNAVPEPGSLVLLASAGLALLGARRRKA